MKKLKATVTITFTNGKMEYLLEHGDVPFSSCLQAMNAAVSDFSNRLFNMVQKKGMSDEELDQAMQDQLDVDARKLEELLKDGDKIITMNGHS